MPRREGMERKDLLAANVKIFKSQGNALDKFAKKDVKVKFILLVESLFKIKLESNNFSVFLIKFY